jgi:hypothetical protein
VNCEILNCKSGLPASITLKSVFSVNNEKKHIEVHVCSDCGKDIMKNPRRSQSMSVAPKEKK